MHAIFRKLGIHHRAASYNVPRKFDFLRINHGQDR
jgi:hypothetical protein